MTVEGFLLVGETFSMECLKRMQHYYYTITAAVYLEMARAECRAHGYPINDLLNPFSEVFIG